MKVLDAFNGRSGRDTVTFASTGRRRAWKLRRDLLLPRYMTEWSELLMTD